MRGKLICDLQYGSTGKGLIAGYLAERDQPDTLVTAWAANAGHTYIDSTGNKYIHTMLANGIVSKGLQRILIGPGSLINPISLAAEINAAGIDRSLVGIMIHPHAAIITQDHRDAEEAGSNTKIGSTKKGVGEAAIQRIRRDPDSPNTALSNNAPHPLLAAYGLGMLVGTVEKYNNAMDCAKVMLVEGAQGFGLSMYHGFYPYTTSRDVTPAQIAADCGIPWRIARSSLDIVGTLRTYPIRVANRFDAEGNMIGTSGPCYSDQREISWEELGVKPEFTTVTKLRRRVFTFSSQQFNEALRMCDVDELFVNFINYAVDAAHARMYLNHISKLAGNYLTDVVYVGRGPAHGDVFDMSEDGPYAGIGEHGRQSALERWLQETSYQGGRQ